MSTRQKTVFIIFMLSLVITFCLTGAAPQTATAAVIYVDVDATGSESGTSWEDAFTDLQNGLNAANPGDQIWVAEGVYRPSVLFDLADPRSVAFEMINNVRIYGGFAGVENNAGDRDWEENETVLSGDIGVEGDSSDNSYHVFYHHPANVVNESAWLDGFTITGGKANGNSEHARGAGMYFRYSGAPILKNCTFYGNMAESGAGMYNLNSSPTLTNCIFAGNSTNAGGGGMSNNRSSLTLTDCIFTDNAAGSNGGAIYNFESNTILVGCTFSENSAWMGGGIDNYESDPMLANCTFDGNSARSCGGGMRNHSNSNPMLENCTFTGNSANWGGGMSSTYYSSSQMFNCVLSGNTSEYYGGGVFVSYSVSSLINCSFSDNMAAHGNAISSSPYYQGELDAINCIFWDDGDEFWTQDNSSFTIAYSNIEGGYEGDGNIDADPIYIDPDGPDNITGTADDNLHIPSNSPCVDAGSPDSQYHDSHRPPAHGTQRNDQGVTGGPKNLGWPTFTAYIPNGTSTFGLPINTALTAYGFLNAWHGVWQIARYVNGSYEPVIKIDS